MHLAEGWSRILMLWAESSGLRQILFCLLELHSNAIGTHRSVPSLTLINCCVSSAKLQAEKGER